jgi:dolichol kinase
MVQKGKLDVRLAKRKEGELKLWRKILKFASLVFPILYFWLNIKYILILIGAFLMIFLVLEFVRVKKKILGLYKKSESKISGFIWYLLGALIATAFFQKEIAILALIFAAVGDNFAILLGIPFGRTKLFRQKTVQGTIACLASSFAAGLIVMPFLNVSLLIIIVGSVAATLAELFSGFYDNLTMAPFSALVMSL